MTNIDEPQPTDVICPLCGKALSTWGKNYFNHCGKRHSVVDNLAVDIKPNENVLTEDDLEDGETLVRCLKCGEFLITTEEKEFEHCGMKQSVEDNLGGFDDLNEGKENTEGGKTPSTKTRTVLSSRKGTHPDGEEKKDAKTPKTREKEGKSNEGEEDSPKENETDEPDKEPETWKCVECECPFTDNGYSDATCPKCGCEYAVPYKED